MANSFYSYVQKSADSYVNWADIGKNMSDMLRETNRVREEKKAAIDQASRDFQEKLNNAPQGEDASARKAALEYADNASKFMLMQDRLLKSGQLKLKDYTVARQNLLDGTEQAFGAMADYQKVFGEKMERYKKGESSLGEVLGMQTAEGYGNWATSGFYINPTNGQIVIAKKDKQIVNGKEIYTMSSNPGEFASVNEVKGLIQGKWDKFNTDSVTDIWASKLGKNVNASSIVGTLSRTGTIRTVNDITNRTDIDAATKNIMYTFLDSENKWIDSNLVNSYDQASILLDRVGSAKDANGNLVPYYFTQDPNVAAKDNAAILKIIDPSTQQARYEFNADQEMQSKEFLRAIARSKYSKEVDIKSTSQISDQTYHAPPKTQSAYDQENMENQAENIAKNFVNMLTGNPASSTNSTKFFSKLTGEQYKKGKTGIYTGTQDGKNQQNYNFNQNGVKATPLQMIESMVAGPASAAGVSQEAIVRAAKRLLQKNAQLNEATEATGFDAQAPTVVKKPISIPNTIFTIKSTQSAKRLQTALPKGFTVSDEGGYFGNTVRVVAPNKEVYEYNANLKSDEIANNKKDLQDFINANNSGVGSKY